MTTTFMQSLIASVETKRSNVCVGLDSRYDRIPESVKRGLPVSKAIAAFNTAVIDATGDVASAFKMNVAFYAGFGAEGLEGLRITNEYIKKAWPGTPVIADCKRSEMGESVRMVEQEIFGWLGFDCVMVTPWFGYDTVRDYLTDPAHGVCVYAHDSNPSASEFQDLVLTDGRAVYEVVTERAVGAWNQSGNVFVEAGATYPEQLSRVRSIIGEDRMLMVAGVGTQGGTIDIAKRVAGAGGMRLLVNSSRGIIFAGEGKTDYFGAVREAAVSLRAALAP